MFIPLRQLLSDQSTRRVYPSCVTVQKRFLRSSTWLLCDYKAQLKKEKEMVQERYRRIARHGIRKVVCMRHGHEREHGRMLRVSEDEYLCKKGSQCIHIDSLPLM